MCVSGSQEPEPSQGSGFPRTKPTRGFRVLKNPNLPRVLGSQERNPLEVSGFSRTGTLIGLRVPGNRTRNWHPYSRYHSMGLAHPKKIPVPPQISMSQSFCWENHFFLTLTMSKDFQYRMIELNGIKYTFFLLDLILLVQCIKLQQVDWINSRKNFSDCPTSFTAVDSAMTLNMRNQMQLFLQSISRTFTLKSQKDWFKRTYISSRKVELIIHLAFTIKT
jgi:hypothetical protein